MLVVGLLIGVPASIEAHALSASCRPRGDHVEVEAYFSDGTIAAEAMVWVTDSEGATVAEGVTDEHGRWRFARPQSGRYRVWVETVGHSTYVDLTPEFLSAGPSREEFTRFPWLKLAIGVAAILALGFGFYYVRRRK